MHVVQLTTQQLEYLLAVDRSPTWSDAASSVGVTPSALSQGIAELERRVGVVLFERDGRRRVPTRDHAEVLRYAERTVAATRDLARWADGRKGGRSGRVRLGLIDAAATHHCRDVLREYRDARPDVELRLTVGPSSALLLDLQRAELDLAVCIQPPETPPGVEITPILSDPLAVLAPTDSSATRPAEWGPWVTFPSGSHTRALVATALAREGAWFDVVAESHQPEVLREMVLLGLGWTVLSLTGIGPVDGLRVVRPDLIGRQLVLARRTGSAPGRAADDLAGALTRGR